MPGFSYERFPQLHDFNPHDEFQAAKALDFVDDILDPDRRADDEERLEQVYDLTELIALRDETLLQGYTDFATDMDARFADYFQDDIDRLEADAPGYEQALGQGDVPDRLDPEEAQAQRERLEKLGMPGEVVDMAQAYRSVMQSHDPVQLQEALEDYGDAAEAMQQKANQRGLAQQRKDPEDVRYRAARQVLHARIQPVGQDGLYIV